MTVFELYLRLGFTHLLDFQGYDHILFLAVLCAPFSLAHWRRLLVLVTAFTVGHSLSLTLAVLEWVRIPTAWVEFTIPLTIVATAGINLYSVRRSLSQSHNLTLLQSVQPQTGWRPLDQHQYLVALVFGVVHGLGFASFLRLLLGAERSLLVPLLAFNVGLELAQVFVAVLVLLLGFVAIRILRVPAKAWAFLLSGLAALLALAMVVRRWPV